ncbi:rhamnulokinase [Kocuria sp.]|uniref:rhamnulokinase n=1 Tax=Kocuria sp. TaxID=1871328 RepID=UPI0026DF0CCF|nr:rhamnulokinase family protein [Kocuria sp.]MDO5618513.1 rhamnulokinase family protein [Kocuria sp.]
MAKSDSRGVVAVDLGATSGRVILGHMANGCLQMRHVARFPNQPVKLYQGESAGLYWNMIELYRNVVSGLAQACSLDPRVASVGVDTWAVDYGLLRNGRLLGVPRHYRDPHNGLGVEAVHAVIDHAQLYPRNGLQHLPFNTIFQLAVDHAEGALGMADRMLMIPDLIGYWLAGVEFSEVTNASTTGLLSVGSSTWDRELMNRLDYSTELLAPLVPPGTAVGPLLPSVRAELGLGDEPGPELIAVGSHDTASAVAAVPLDEDSAYISAGTWSLVGVELETPVLTAESRAANFTNELGVDGRVRFLKNVSGLWLLSESIRRWESPTVTDSQRTSDLAELISQAEAVTRPVPVFDTTDERFTPPGDIPARIRQWCIEHDVEPPRDRAETVRSILESLAEGYAHTIQQAQELSGRQIRTVHVVGGGSQNHLLCQLTADRTGLPVIAGPVEATAMGNLLVQLRATGQTTGSLEAMRSIVKNTAQLRRYEPRSAAENQGQRR